MVPSKLSPSTNYCPPAFDAYEVSKAGLIDLLKITGQAFTQHQATLTASTAAASIHCDARTEQL